MIKKIYLLAAVALTLTACNEEITGGATQKGRLDISRLGIDVNNYEEVIDSRAVVDVSDYLIDLYKGETLVKSWTYGDKTMQGALELDPGTYSVKVRSHELKDFEWDHPYFAGTSEPIEVKVGELAEAGAVTCTFGSLKVSVTFGEKLRPLLGDDVKVTVTASTDATMVVTPSETRAGYFSVPDGSVTMVATFEGTVDGQKETIRRAYTDIAAGQHRIISYDRALLPDPTGRAETDGIAIDVTVTDIDLTVDVNTGSTEEEVIDAGPRPDTLPEIGGGDEPTPAGDFYISGDMENGKEYWNTDLLESAKLTIHCPKGIDKAEVVIDSDFLTPDELQGVGLTDKFDLANPDPSLTDGLSSLGFPYGDQVKGKTEAVIDVTPFMTLLGVGGTSTSTFSFKVTDMEGNVLDFSFVIKVK